MPIALLAESHRQARVAVPGREGLDLEIARIDRELQAGIALDQVLGRDPRLHQRELPAQTEMPAQTEA